METLFILKSYPAIERIGSGFSHKTYPRQFLFLAMRHQRFNQPAADAAHPALQYLAQGACMAMEDAVVLAAKLAQAGSDINAALLAYEKERYYRTARVQITARIFGEIIHCAGGARDLRNHLLEQREPGSSWEVDWLYRGIQIPP